MLEGCADAPGSRMHGRGSELGILQDAFLSLWTEPRRAAITIVAEAGLGKSRLLQAFDDTCHASPGKFICYRGGAVPATQDQPFGVLRSILLSHCGLMGHESHEIDLARFEQTLMPLFGPVCTGDAASAHVHRLGYLIGLGYGDSPHVLNILNDPRRVRDCGLAAARQIFEQPGTSPTPTLIRIEDLHWADSDSLDFLQQLCDAQPQQPILMLCSARPALFERRPAWGGADETHRRITLTPLDRLSSRTLADDLLCKLATIPPMLRAMVADSPDGNPFHMEQLVGLMIDTGALRSADGVWAADAEQLLAMPWPATLTGVLQARLAALPAALRQGLQMASLIGPDFSGHALRVLDDRASLSLPASLTSEIVSQELPDDRADRREFSFTHQVLQEATYNSMPDRARRAGHKKLALWFAGLLKRQRTSHAMGVAAEHFERAGESAQAAEYHTQAAEHAADRFAHESALAHVQRALDLLDSRPRLPGDAALRWRLHARREVIYQTLARRGEQREAIDALAAIADMLADDRLRADAACRLSSLSSHLGQFEAQRDATRRAMTLAEQAGDQGLYLRALRSLGDAQCKLGDWDAGQRILQQCLELARARADVFAQAQCFNTLAVIAAQRQDPVGRVQMHEQEVDLRKQLDDRRPEAVALANLGGGWLDLGELFLARKVSEEALGLLRSMRNRQTEATVLCNLSNLARWLGDSAQALTLARAAVAAALDAGSPPWEAYALTRVGDSELALGQHAAAAEAYARAHRLSIELKMSHQHECTAGLARVALVQADFKTAMRHVQRVLDHEANTGQAHGAKNAVRVDLVCHLVLAGTEDPRAPAWLQRAHGQLQAMAGRIADPALRRGFLGNIPEHRAVTSAWAVAQAEGDPLASQTPMLSGQP